MADDEFHDEKEAFEKALKDQHSAHYVLQLFISGNTHMSHLTIENLRQVCEQNLKGRYQLEVIDISQQPEMARKHQVVATPTLVKSLPPPMRKIIGNLSDEQRILVGLNLIEVKS